MTRKSKQPTKSFGIQSTENMNIDVDKLPEFSRANKYIGEYNVYVRNNIVPDGTRCTIFAFSSKTGNGELRNNVAIVRDGIAKFDDLRFVGKSGRGTRFDVFFNFDMNPPITVTYKYAIKVTVDGPRPPRSPKNDTSMSSSMSVESPNNINSKRKLHPFDEDDMMNESNSTNSCKMLKMKNYFDYSADSRRESYSSSKSPAESSSSSSSSMSSYNMSVNSYPCSPIILHHQPQSSLSSPTDYYLQMLAETAHSLGNLDYNVDQIIATTTTTTARTGTNEINGGFKSEEIRNYFWFLVHKYICMFHENLIADQQNLCT